jgi:hypothetical protein
MKETVAVLVSLLCAGLLIGHAEAAGKQSVDFEPPEYAPGPVHGQDGWVSLGSVGAGCATYDVEVVDNTYRVSKFGSQTLRISNAVTSGCFGDQTFSKPLTDEAGESTAENGGLSDGTRRRRFEAQWSFASTEPDAEQPGLSVVASPDRGDGARMSFLGMADTPSGLQVTFYDYQRGATVDPCGCCPPFVCTVVASGLDRTKRHTIKIIMDFVEGESNDVVKVFIDGKLVHTGTSWEDYFRDEEGVPTRTVDSLLFRVGGTAQPATLGKGFVIDNLELKAFGNKVKVAP